MMIYQNSYKSINTYSIIFTREMDEKEIEELNQIISIYNMKLTF